MKKNVLLAITAGLVLFVAINYINRQSSSSESDSVEASIVEIDYCTDFFGYERNSLTPEQVFECQKLYSVPNKDGYSRYSYYPNEVRLTGTYKLVRVSEDHPDYFVEPQTFHLLPQVEDFEKLPDSPYLHSSKRLNFSSLNLDPMDAFSVNDSLLLEMSTFESCTLSGEATVVVSELLIDNFEGGIPLIGRLSADLDEVISKTNYSLDCK